MKILLCLLSAVVFIRNAAGQDSAAVSSFTKFPEEITVDLKPVFNIRPETARNIFLVDSTFYMRNDIDDGGHHITAYSSNGKKNGREYIKTGGGAGHVAGGMSAGFWNSRKMWVHDLVLNKIVIADGFDKSPDKDHIRIYEYKLPFDFYWIDMVDSNHVVGVGAGTDNSKSKLHEVELSTGKIVGNYGTFGNPPTGIPLNSWKMAYQAFVYAKPGGDIVAMACRFSDQVEFFNRKTGTDKIVKGPENFDVAFKPIQAGNFWAMQRVDETRFAFQNGMATEKYLYLLYGGHNHEDPKINKGRSIYVYDWDGNPVRKITLSNYVTAFAVSNDGKTLYCDNGDGTILRGTLK
jgi:hypothetical protein